MAAAFRNEQASMLPARSTTFGLMTSSPSTCPSGCEHMSSSTFGKRQREQDKRAKAEAKRQRRQRGGDSDASEQPPVELDRSSSERGSIDDVLNKLADLHQHYEAGTLSFDEFETTKAELLAQIVLD